MTVTLALNEDEYHTVLTALHAWGSNCHEQAVVGTAQRQVDGDTVAVFRRSGDAAFDLMKRLRATRN